MWREAKPRRREVSDGSQCCVGYSIFAREVGPRIKGGGEDET